MSRSGNVILVDAEHFGIRLLMPLLTIGGIVVGFFLGSAILHQLDESIAGACLGVPMAAVSAYFLVQIGERIIKPNWTSGRHIELSEQALEFIDKRGGRNNRYTFSYNSDLKIDGWYFEITGRRHRVPKGWYCTAVQLAQDEQEVIIYSFINPEEAHEIKEFVPRFEQLTRTKKKNVAQSGPTMSNVRMTARQKYLRTLEDERWEDGAEVTPEDFKQIMQHI